MRAVPEIGEAGDHQFKIVCLTEDGQPLGFEIEGSFPAPKTFGGAAQVILNMQLGLPKHGRYEFILTIDKQQAARWTLESKAPPQPFAPLATAFKPSPVWKSKEEDEVLASFELELHDQVMLQNVTFTSVRSKQIEEAVDSTGSDAMTITLDFRPTSKKILSLDGDYPLDFLVSLSELPQAPNDVVVGDDSL
jgi:hypothetical protein